MTNTQIIVGLKDVAASMRKENLEKTQSFKIICETIAQIYDDNDEPQKASFWRSNTK